MYLTYEVYIEKQVTKFPVMTSKKDSLLNGIILAIATFLEFISIVCKVYLAYCGKASLHESWWTYVTSKKIINIVACESCNSVITICQHCVSSVTTVHGAIVQILHFCKHTTTFEQYVDMRGYTWMYVDIRGYTWISGWLLPED